MTLRRLLSLVFLIFLASNLVVIVPHCRADDDGFDLTLKKVFPCQETPPDSNVSLYRSDILAVQANLSFCNSSWNTQQYNGFRMYASAEANSTYPVIFIARQTFDGTVSFSIPLQPEGFSLSFTDVSRTLCPVEDPPGIVPTLFYIDVFTSSPDPLQYSVEIEPVDNFTLSLDENYQTVISPSSPQIFYFKMPDGIDVVTVAVATDSKKCAIVSVQNKTCPVNDLLENARSKGIFQTMSTSAVLTIEAPRVMNREFLLVLIATGYTICHDEELDDGNDTYMYEQHLNITIKESKPVSHYWKAFLVPLFVFFIIPYSLTLPALFLCSPKLRCVPTWTWKCVCQKPFKCIGCLERPYYLKEPFCSKHPSLCCCNRTCQGDEESISLMQENGVGTKNYQTIDRSAAQAGSVLHGKVADDVLENDSINYWEQGIMHECVNEVLRSKPKKYMMYSELARLLYFWR